MKTATIYQHPINGMYLAQINEDGLFYCSATFFTPSEYINYCIDNGVYFNNIQIEIK